MVESPTSSRVGTCSSSSLLESTARTSRTWTSKCRACATSRGWCGSCLIRPNASLLARMTPRQPAARRSVVCSWSRGRLKNGSPLLAASAGDGRSGRPCSSCISPNRAARQRAGPRSPVAALTPRPCPVPREKTVGAVRCTMARCGRALTSTAALLSARPSAPPSVPTRAAGGLPGCASVAAPSLRSSPSSRRRCLSTMCAATPSLR